MQSTSIAARVTAAVGVAVTTLALVGAAGAAGGTLFAIGSMLTDDSAQPITLVAKRGPSATPKATVLALAERVGTVRR